MSKELNNKTKEIFMSTYEAKSVEEAMGKMNDLQYRIREDDEETGLLNNSTSSSYSLLESWLKKCSMRSRTHTAASISNGRLHSLISVPTILLSGAAAGLAFWATSDENGTSHEVRILVAGLSATSAVFSSLTRLFKFNEKGYQHKMAAGMYSQLCRKIEVNVFSPSPLTSINGIQTLLAEVSVQFSNTILFSPSIKVN